MTQNPGAAVLIVSPDGQNSAQVDANGNLRVAIAGADITVNVDDINGVQLNAGESHIGTVGGHVLRPAATFARPANTTAYAVGDLVANSETAGVVVPMAFAVSRTAGLGGMIRRATIRKTGASVTSSAFRLHLYTSAPVVSNGDGGAWLSNRMVDYAGSIDVVVDRAFTDGAVGVGAPDSGSELNFTADVLYGLIEARGAYTPASGETFAVELESLPN